MFLLVTRPPGRRQDGKLSKRVVCLCLAKSHIKVEIQNMNNYSEEKFIEKELLVITMV